MPQDELKYDHRNINEELVLKTAFEIVSNPKVNVIVSLLIQKYEQTRAYPNLNTHILNTVVPAPCTGSASQRKSTRKNKITGVNNWLVN